MTLRCILFLFSALDEIVLSYVTSIAEELTQDDVSGFDGDAFVEMLTAYLPQADNIEVGDAVRWMTGLANSLRNAKKHGTIIKKKN